MITHVFRGYGEDLKEKNIQRFKEQGLYFQKIFAQEFGRPTPRVALYNFDEKTKKISKRINLDLGQKVPEDKVGVFKLYCWPKVAWHREAIETPVFIFGNRNEVFNNYIDSISGNKIKEDKIKPDEATVNGLKILREGKDVNSEVYTNDGRIYHENGEREWDIPCIRYPGIAPIRWCHAELALVPTKKSLNILFFEIGEPKETEEEK